MMHFSKRILSCFFLFSLSLTSYSQNNTPPDTVAGFPVNYNEDAIPPYTLPKLLEMENGQAVKDSKTWMNKRRPELLRAVAELQYTAKLPLLLKKQHLTF